jgi:preprotein translocase subunit YajC
MFETAYAMGPSTGGSQGGSPLTLLLPFVLIFVVFYFLMVRPQQKKQKQHREMISNLRKGDRVVTTGGMFGTIVGINEKDNVVVLKVGEETKLEFLRSAIAGRVDKGESSES